MNRSISAVLPNYNGRALLEKNLPSLLDALNGIEHEIIVVDDCSTDESAAFLQQHYPDIRLLRNEVNRGFSYTCNRGIEAASRDLAAVINTDVTFTPDYFAAAIAEFEDPGLFAVKGDIVNYADSVEEVINIDRTTRLYYRRGFLRFDTRNPLTARAVFSGSDSEFVALGCCFLCRRDMLRELGGFDEIYSPYYWEDSDLARRAMQAGYRLLYLPDAKVFHQASSTLGSYTSRSRRRLISNRNKFLFTWRHLDHARLLYSHAPLMAVNLLTRWLILDWRFYAAFFRALGRYARNPRRHSAF